MKKAIEKTQVHNEGKNAGFTMVELIVSMAILSVVGVMIITFFSYSLVQYQRNANEVNVQKESQIAWKQMESMILTTTNGISKKDGSLYLYSQSPSGVKTCAKFYLDDVESKIMYQAYTYSEPSSTWVEDGGAEIFADYVSTFDFHIYDAEDNEIDTSLAKNKKPVRVDAKITYVADDRSFSANNTVALRNTLAASNLMREIYE